MPRRRLTTAAIGNYAARLPVWSREPAAGICCAGGSFHSVMTNWTAVYVEVPEGYAAFVEELPGANTQGATIDEARENLQEAIALVLEANRALSKEGLEGKRVIREQLPIAG